MKKYKKGLSMRIVMNKKLLLVTILLSFYSCTNLFADSTPTTSRVYGKPFATKAIAQSGVIGSYGALDTTFGTLGALDISSVLTNSVATVMATLSDGSFFVGCDNGVDTVVIAKYTSTGMLDTSFANPDGFVTFTATGFTGLQAMSIDSYDRIVIAGDDGTNAWMRRINADGTYVHAYAFPGSALGSLYAVAHQSTQNILTAGSDGTNGTIIRFLPTGFPDTSFGDNGVITFNGTQITGLTSIVSLQNIIVDAENNFYVFYCDGTAAKVAKFDENGALVTAFNGTGIYSATGFDNYNVQTMKIAFHESGDLILAASNSTTVKLQAINAISAANSGTFSNLTAVSGADTVFLSDIITTNDGNLFILYYNETNTAALVKAVTSAGLIDSSFATSGTLTITPVDSTDTIMYRGAIGAQGQLYFTLSSDASAVLPYVYRVYTHLVPSTNEFLEQVAQQQNSVEQGTIDETFGDNPTYPGVMIPYCGNYGASLQQKIKSIIELSSGKFLIALDGYLDDTGYSRIIISRLESDGAVDTDYGTNGFVTLADYGYLNLYATGLLEQNAGNSVVVTGYSDDGDALVYLIDEDGDEINFAYDVDSDKAINALVQGTRRILVFHDVTDSSGKITAYTPNLSGVDSTFGQSGYITTASFSGALADMGPLYGHAVDSQGNILIAYKNSDNDKVDVAKIAPDGDSLITDFGNNGVVLDVFNGGTANSIYDVKLVLDNAGNLFVATVLSASQDTFSVAKLLAADGTIDNTFGIFTTQLDGDVVLNHFGILNDNTLLMTGYVTVDTENFMVTVRAIVDSESFTGTLDEDFNPQGDVPGVAYFQVGHIRSNYFARNALGLAVNSESGDMILAGYEQATETTSNPLVMQIFGKPDTYLKKQYPALRNNTLAGTVDSSFGLGNDDLDDDGSKDLTDFFGASVAKVVYAYPVDSDYQGYLLIGVDNGSTVTIGRVQEAGTLPDLDFGTQGKVTLSSVSGLQCLMVDQNNEIIVGGSTNDTTGWIRKLSANGNVETSFTLPDNTSMVFDIKQQRSGRYICCGSNNNLGFIFALRDTGVVDETFNPLNGTPGTITIGSTALIPTLAIYEDDTIFVGYSDTADSDYVKLVKFQANGLVDGNFGSAGAANVGATSENLQNIKIAIDSLDRVVIATTSNNNTEISLAPYDVYTGVRDGIFASNTVLVVNGIGANGVTLTSMMINENNKIMLFGYNESGSNGRIFAVCVDQNGSLESTWNIHETDGDAAGINTFTIGGVTQAYGSAIYFNGMIYCVGANTDSYEEVPLLMRLFGYDYIVALEQQPFESAAGFVDSTIDTETPGSNALNFEDYLAFDFLSDDTNVKKFYIYPDGAMLVGFHAADDNKIYIVKLKSDFTVDMNFNNETGYYEVLYCTNIIDIILNNGVNGDNSIYVLAAWWDLPILFKLDENGNLAQNFTFYNTSYDLHNPTSIKISTNQRILITGNDNEDQPMVCAFQSNGATDLSYGNGLGYYLLPVGIDRIDDLVMNELDEQLISYISGTNVRIDRIFPNGSDLVTNLWQDGYIEQSCTNPIVSKLALSQDQMTLYLAVQDGNTAGNIWKVFAYSMQDGSLQASEISSISYAGIALNLVSLFVDDDYNIYLAGYNATDDKAVIARLTWVDESTIGLDTTYAAGTTSPEIEGVAHFDAGDLQVITDAAYHPDRRVYFIGNSTTYQSFIGRVFGDIYTEQVNIAPELALAGDIDYTFDNFENGQDGFINLRSLSVPFYNVLGNATARAIAIQDDGSALIACSVGSDVVVAKVNADFQPDTDFGTQGLTTPYIMQVVHDIKVNDNGEFFVSGIHYGAQSVAHYYASGTLNNIFPTTVMSSVATRTLRQKSGRYLVSGKKDSSGIISAYQSISPFMLDSTFGPAFTPAVADGYYETGVNAQVDDFVIDNYDRIFLVYRHPSNNHVYVEKITANGSAKDFDFGENSAVDTGIVANQKALIAIDENNNILVGATTADGFSFVMLNGIDGTTTIDTYTPGVQTVNSPVLLTDINVSYNLLQTEPYYYLSGFNLDSDDFFVMRVKGFGSDLGQIDTTFGDSGYASNDISGLTTISAAAIKPDGKMVAVGSHSGTDPVALCLYLESYQPSYEQGQIIAAAGAEDRTLSPEQGDLNLDELLPSLNLTADSYGANSYVASKIYTYENNDILILFTSDTSILLARLRKDLTLHPWFNASGTAGYVEVTGLPELSSQNSILHVDDLGNIFVAGGINQSFVLAFDEYGDVLSNWAVPGDTLSAGAYALARQSSYSLILAGQNTYGSLLSYTTEGDLDPEFGNGTPGIFSTSINAPIEAIALHHESDDIYIALNNSGTLVIQKVFAHGSDIDENFVIANPIENVNGHGIKMVTTVLDHLVVAVATDDGLVVAVYDMSDGSEVADQVMYDEDIDSDYFYVTDMYTTNDGKVVVVGYDTDYYGLFVARLTNQYIPDTSFAYGQGYFLDTVGSMEFVYGARIYNDNRILCVGENDDNEPYMARLFGDTYQDVFEQTGVLGVPGTIDTTYHADTDTPGYLNLSALQGFSDETVAFGLYANAIVQDNNGKYLVTGKTNDGKLFLARYLSTGLLDETFASVGYVVDGTHDGGEGFGIAVDSSDGIFVAGYAVGEGAVAYVVKFTDAGIIDTTFTNGYGSQGYIYNFLSEQFNDIAIDGNGKLVVIGTGDNSSSLVLARYLASGLLDTSTFNSANTPGYVLDYNASEGQALVVDSSNNIFVAGMTADNSGYIAKYLSTGALDTAGFNASGETGYESAAGTIIESGASELYDIILDNYGKIVVAGVGNSYGFIARYSSAGAYDTTLHSSGFLYNSFSSKFFGLAVGQDVNNYEDYIFACGRTELTPEGFVIRYNNAGSLDLDFMADGSYACYDLVLNATDNPVVTGTTSDELKVFTALYADDGDLTTLFGSEGSILFDESQVVGVIAQENGVHYIAFNNNDEENSFVIRLNSADEFDTSYSMNGISETTRRGARFMMIDGESRIVLVGNDDNPWITRYNTDGTIDFEIVDETMNAINVVREQTLTRLVGVGTNSDGYATVCAYTDEGAVDTTFNSLGDVPGQYTFGLHDYQIHSLIIDEYDRLIIPVFNSDSGDVDLYRLTSNGELDTSFGDGQGYQDLFTGYIASALTNVYADSSSIKVTIDEIGNIVLVAIGLDESNPSGILLASFDNGINTIAEGGNGAPVGGYDGGLIFTAGLSDHVITDIVSIENEEILVCGYKGSAEDMWVASITSLGEEDWDFNPDGDHPGILEFSVDQFDQDARVVQGMAIRYDGRISVVFYETLEGVSISYLGRIYNEPFEEGLEQAPNSENVGTYNTGFGLNFDNSISFYATSDADETENQIAQAVTLQGNNRIVVALDGQTTEDTTSRVFINKFTIDGLLDVAFNETGQVEIPHEYNNEYVRDAYAFMTPEGINKILLAGYAYNNTLGVLTSWLMQYDLDNITPDSSFGGFDNDATGTTSGDIQELYTIALQSSGNIIASGLYFDDSGAIVSYTSSGKLDTNFGSSGIYFHSDAQDGIFSHVVDAKNRIVFGYVDDQGVVVLARLLADGSGLDSSFNSVGIATDEIINISDSEHVRVAVNSDNEVYVAAVQDDSIYVAYYGESGGLGSSAQIAIPDIEDLTIARLIIDLEGNITIFVSDNNETNGDDYIIVQLSSDLSLNTEFNGQGYIKYKVNSAAERRQARDGVLHNDGRFIGVGSEQESVVI